MSFEGKVVAITGGGVGMGREAAILYAKQGAKVVVNSLSIPVWRPCVCVRKQVARQPSYREMWRKRHCVRRSLTRPSRNMENWIFL